MKNEVFNADEIVAKEMFEMFNHPILRKTVFDFDEGYHFEIGESGNIYELFDNDRDGVKYTELTRRYNNYCDFLRGWNADIRCWYVEGKLTLSHSQMRLLLNLGVLDMNDLTRGDENE